MELGIQGKTAIVTGGTQGIGLEIVRALAAEGAAVAFCDLKDAAGSAAAKSLQAEGRRVFYQHCDVGSETEINAFYQAALAALGPADILVNNAGISPKTAFDDISAEELQTVLQVDLMGAFFFAQAVIPHMCKQRWGRIINLSSMAGRFGANKAGAHYAAAKAGLLGLSLSLAKKLGPSNITVNCVAPGRIDTDLTRVLPEGVKEELRQAIPLGRFGKASEVASVVAFLSSEQASYVSGACIDVLGAYIA